MTIDSGASHVLLGVVTQGCNIGTRWVTEFTLAVSEDGEVFEDIEGAAVYEGNNDAATKAYRYFPATVARYVRLHPKLWVGAYFGIRAALLVSPAPPSPPSPPSMPPSPPSPPSLPPPPLLPAYTAELNVDEADRAAGEIRTRNLLIPRAAC